MIELLGLAGTCMILIAFSCNTEKNIRVLDAIGAGFFVAYGLLTRTWSTAILNVALIGIQAFKLLKRKGDV